MNQIVLSPIGVIHSHYKEPVNVPIQPRYAKNSKAQIKLFSEYISGLKNLDLFSHIIVLYHLHRSEKNYKLHVTPFLDNVERGVFATRAPKRPNGIGISIVSIDKIENNTIFVDQCDMLDQTPVIDIKPYFPEFDIYENASNGWYDEIKMKEKKKTSDDRFK